MYMPFCERQQVQGFAVGTGVYHVELKLSPVNRISHGESFAVQGQKHSLDAAQFIARAAAEHPGKVVVLALGPLTNIALAFKVNTDVDKNLVRHQLACLQFQQSRCTWDTRN